MEGEPMIRLLRFLMELIMLLIEILGAIFGED